MREKLAEYKADGAEWPLTACILDPIRSSLVCSGPSQMLEVIHLIFVPLQTLMTLHFQGYSYEV